LPERRLELLNILKEIERTVDHPGLAETERHIARLVQ
jgi:hypothetical protein